MGPLISRYSKILTHILRKYFKENRFLVKFRGYEETEDFNAQATAYSTLSNAGIISPSRAAHLMHLPVDIDLPSPIIVTKTGPILLEDFANPELRKAQMEAQMAGLQLAKQNPGGAQPQNDDGNEDEEDNENAPQSPNQKKSAKSAAPTKPAQKTAQDDNEDDDGDGEKDTPPKRYSRADLERLLAPYKIDLDEVFREERPPQPVAQSGIWRKGSCPCEECTTNDGAIRKIGESYPSGATQPGGHASCDCTVEPVTEEEQQRAMALEYKRWRGRALDDVKAGKPFRGFTTTIIPSEMHHAIETEVHRCTTADEVRTVFQRVKDEESFFVGAAVSGGQQSLLQRYNHNHDAKGRFAAGSGGDSGGSGGGGGSGMAAKSKAAQLRALEKEMATKHPDTHFDFTGTDPAVMGPVCQQLDHLMTKYPEVGQSLAYIGTGKNAPEGYGAENLAPLGMACTVARRAGSTPYASIVLNKDEFGNASSMNAEVQKCVASAWLANGAAAGGAQYLITHEFGHVVDAYLATAGRNAQVGNVYDVATAAYTFSGNSTRMGNKVSGYAQSGGPVEMFAEGFASLHFAPPAQQAAYTKRLGALLDKVLPGGSSSSWQTRV